MKNVLVIGSEGYLGSRLTEYLEQFGNKVTGIDLGFFRHGVLTYPKDIYRIQNKEARNIVLKDIDGFDVVILLAGISNDPIGTFSPEEIYNPTRDYAVKIARFCKELGVKYIYPSSCSVYGIGDSSKSLTEMSRVNPQTHYSKNKLEVENELKDLADKNFSPIALRLATIFGASHRIRFDVVVNMLCGMAVANKKIILNSNGLAWRPHLHIDDACEAFARAIDWDYDEGKLAILNVGRDDNNRTILDIANLINKEMPECGIQFLGKNEDANDASLIRDKKIQDGVDTRTYKVSFEKIHKILPNFKAIHTLESGIPSLLEHFRKLKLDSNKFQQREFYRLQQIEYLFESKQIDSRLRFL